jgi:hypothetical protein
VHNCGPASRRNRASRESEKDAAATRPTDPVRSSNRTNGSTALFAFTSTLNRVCGSSSSTSSRRDNGARPPTFTPFT